METPSLFDLHIDGESTRFLKEISRWAKFLAVLGFLMCGLFLLISIVLIVGASNPLLQDGFQTSGIGVTSLGVIYLVCTVASIFPYLYLFQFATKMQRALQSSDQDSLSSSFSNLKSCFKFVGVITIITIGFTILGVIVMNFVAFT